MGRSSTVHIARVTGAHARGPARANPPGEPSRIRTSTFWSRRLLSSTRSTAASSSASASRLPNSTSRASTGTAEQTPNAARCSAAPSAHSRRVACRQRRVRAARFVLPRSRVRDSHARTAPRWRVDATFRRIRGGWMRGNHAPMELAPDAHPGNAHAPGCFPVACAMHPHPRPHRRRSDT